MRKKVVLFLFTLLLLTACTAKNPSTVIQPDETEGQSYVATSTDQVEVPASSTPTTAPTFTPTPSPTPKPVRFDKAGYKQFVILRNSFPGFWEYLGDRNFTEISSSLSPDGNLVAISACWGSLTNSWKCETRNSGFLIVIDVNTGEVVNDIPLNASWPGNAAFTPDGKSLLFSTDAHEISLWNLTTNKSALTLLKSESSGRTIYPDVAIAPDGNSFVAVVEETLYVWNSSGELLFHAPATQGVASAALGFTADGSRMLLFSPDRTGADVYDTSNWTILRRFAISDIGDAEISPNGRWLAGINQSDQTVIVWDVEDGSLLATLDPGIRGYTLEFNPASDLLLVSGMGKLEKKDDYSIIGALYDTQSWLKLEDLHSYSTDGSFEFNQNGSRMIVFGFYDLSIWGLPDDQLVAGFELLKEFQADLAKGDYASAASLFEVDEREKDYLAEKGIDSNDLEGSFRRLCTDETVFCHSVKELVFMGYDWETMVYLVRLEGEGNEAFVSPEGAQIIYMYVSNVKDGKPKVITLPQE